ncbi:hypothetical protein PG994_011830 [Apiospora phragmitis]|uniref:Uncharacterized protein n=1 Tax=Apiospora phragmitis TaxID=2905665 RepID=A0ABR1TTY5_9PEZI
MPKHKSRRSVKGISAAGMPAASSGSEPVIPQKRKRPDDNSDADEHFPHDLDKCRKDVIASLESNEFDNRVSKLGSKRLRQSWKGIKTGISELDDLANESFIQIQDCQEEIAIQKTLPSELRKSQLPHHLEQTANADNVTIIQQLQEENAKLKSDQTSIGQKKNKRVRDLEEQLLAKDALHQNKVAELGERHEQNTKTIHQLRGEITKIKSDPPTIDRQREKRISDLEEQLVAKSTQLEGKVAELDEQHDQNTEYQPQIEVQEEEIAEQANENQRQALLIQHSESTIKRQAEELEQANATIQQFVHDNAIVQTLRGALGALLNRQ